MKKIIVIGHTGYLGSNLISHFAKAGIEFSLSEYSEDLSHITYLDQQQIIFDASFPPDYKEKATFENYFNLLTLRLKQAKARKIGYVYLASYSSLTLDKSKYGESKLLSENLVESYGGALLRLGLVVSDTAPGGRYKEFQRILTRLPFLIVPSTKWCAVTVTDINDFFLAVDNIISSGSLQNLNASSKIMPISDLARGCSNNKLVITLPDFLTKIVVNIVRTFPFGKLDNLKSTLAQES